MSLDTALGKPTFASEYERVVVPAIFERYARDLVARARPIGASERILDLGCGTGIVARVLRERLGGAANVVGLDVNPNMLAVARSVAPEIDFREGSAMGLPFADASFDLVLCQEMLQFPPDTVGVLREVRRVLSPGGRLFASTWRRRGEQPFHEALGRVAERHLGTPNDKRWSLDAAALEKALAEAGFVDIRLETVSFTEHHREFSTRQNALAANFDLSGLSEDEKERRFAAVEADSAEVFARFALDDGFGAPSFANVASAVSPRTRNGGDQ
ncbi:MAG TPA: class I SAM-dependent methyltransferase [Polyangiaceae bacterium]